MIDGRLYASLDKLRRSSKNNVAALADRVLYGFFHQIGSQILIAESSDFIRESLFQVEPAQLVGVSPCGGGRRLHIQESDLQFRRTERKQPCKKRLLFLCRIHLQLDLVVMFQKMEFLPAFRYHSLHLSGCLFTDIPVSIYSQKCQKRVSRRDRELLSSRRLEFRRKSCIDRAESKFVLVRPYLVRLFPQKILEFRKTSQLCKPDIVYLGKLVKVHELIINLVFFFVCFRRQDSGHISRNRNGVIIFQDAYPFIAFLHIKFIHILVSFNWITDAFIQMTFA